MGKIQLITCHYCKRRLWSQGDAVDYALCECAGSRAAREPAPSGVTLAWYRQGVREPEIMGVISVAEDGSLVVVPEDGYYGGIVSLDQAVALARLILARAVPRAATDAERYHLTHTREELEAVGATWPGIPAPKVGSTWRNLRTWTRVVLITPVPPEELERFLYGHKLIADAPAQPDETVAAPLYVPKPGQCNCRHASNHCEPHAPGCPGYVGAPIIEPATAPLDDAAQRCPERESPISGMCVLRNSKYGPGPVTCSIRPDGRVCCSRLGGDSEHQAVPVLVSDPQPEPEANCSSCWSAPGTGHDPDCNRSTTQAAADTGVIRAAEGVVLEPGEYVSEPNDLDYPPIAIKAPLRAQACTWGSGWCFAFGPQGWVRAARRVEVEPEDTRSPFQKRNGLNADGTIRRVEARAEPTEGPESLLQACALLEQTSQGEPK